MNRRTSNSAKFSFTLVHQKTALEITQLCKTSQKYARIFFAISISITWPCAAWAAPLINPTAPTDFLKKVFAFVFLLMVIKLIFSSPLVKGKIGEAKVRHLTSLHLDEQTYHQLHNVTLPTSDGTTQIDHIIVSPFGIFVIETKFMTGWIYGNPQAANWTQTFKNKKFPFQNPLRQNYKHTKELGALLKVSDDKIFSVVAFVGDAVFKTPMPDNVLQAKELTRYILSKEQTIFTELDVQNMAQTIKKSMLDQSSATDREHIEHLNAKFGTTGRTWNDELKLLAFKTAGLAVVLLIALKILSTVLTAPLMVLQKPRVQSQQQRAAISTPIPHPPVQPSAAITLSIPVQPERQPRSSDYGFLTLTAQQDSYITLYDEQKKDVVHMELNKGESKRVEIKKGRYTAEILQHGKRELSSVSFISNTGLLNF